MFTKKSKTGQIRKIFMGMEKAKKIEICF